MNKTMKIIGIVAFIAAIIMVGTIGYIIGDYGYLDWELIGEFLLIYAPAMVSGICGTYFVMKLKNSEKEEP